MSSSAPKPHNEERTEPDVVPRGGGTSISSTGEGAHHGSVTGSTPGRSAATAPSPHITPDGVQMPDAIPHSEPDWTPAEKVRMGIDSDSGEYGLQEDAHAALNGLLEQLETLREDRDYWKKLALDAMSEIAQEFLNKTDRYQNHGSPHNQVWTHTDTHPEAATPTRCHAESLAPKTRTETPGALSAGTQSSETRGAMQSLLRISSSQPPSPQPDASASNVEGASEKSSDSASNPTSTAPLSAHFEYVDGDMGERRVWNPASEGAAGDLNVSSSAPSEEQRCAPMGEYEECAMGECPTCNQPHDPARRVLEDISQLPGNLSARVLADAYLDAKPASEPETS